MLLIPVALAADATREAHAGALLDHVRRFVGRRVKIRRAGESNVVADSVRPRSDRPRDGGRVPVLMCACLTNIVSPERSLNLGEMRKRAAAAASAVRCRLENRWPA